MPIFCFFPSSFLNAAAAANYASSAFPKIVHRAGACQTGLIPFKTRVWGVLFSWSAVISVFSPSFRQLMVILFWFNQPSCGRVLWNSGDQQSWRILPLSAYSPLFHKDRDKPVSIVLWYTDMVNGLRCTESWGCHFNHLFSPFLIIINL